MILSTSQPHFTPDSPLFPLSRHRGFLSVLLATGSLHKLFLLKTFFPPFCPVNSCSILRSQPKHFFHGKSPFQNLRTHVLLLEDLVTVAILHLFVWLFPYLSLLYSGSAIYSVISLLYPQHLAYMVHNRYSINMC